VPQDPLNEELAKLCQPVGPEARYAEAASLFRQLVEALGFSQFLIFPAYDMITAEAA
jgi:hypothetical protein